MRRRIIDWHSKRNGTYFVLYPNGFKFSINEGVFPNIHVNVSTKGFFIYVALTERLKTWKGWGDYE